MALISLSAAACSEAPPPRLPAVGERPAGWVDVRLSLPTDRPPTLGSDGPLVIVDAQGGECLRARRLPSGSPLRLSDGIFYLGDDRLGPPPLEVRPVTGAALLVEGGRYRGLLLLETTDEGKVIVLNRLDIEAYLKGVLPGEMPERFGLEALKAQAVAARSYALSEGARRGWLHPDVRSQVYGGRDVETWLCSEAVEQTAGQVLTYEGEVISAWFQSTCGGGTARAADVFPAAPAGLLDRQVVCSDCRHSPTWSWSRTLDPVQVCEAAGLEPAPLEHVETEPSFYPGRPEWITVTAGGKSARLPVVDFRAAVSRGKARDDRLLSTRWASLPRVEPEGLVVDGHGWGHGVGLCQYGAGGYARRGAGYRAILRRYYPGAELVQLF